ncbi:MAG: methyltransferase domain-containing protein [Pseudomonadota bacterium]
MTADAIKSMKLYSGVDRVHQALAAEGYDPDDPLPLSALTQHDQLHYFGTDAVDEAVELLNPPTNGRVLDIGSGYGGPARYFADRTGASVTAVELQQDLDQAAADLTARAQITGSVQHVCGDILQVNLDDACYDGAISYLALYHIPAREPLFPRLFQALKPGAAIYVEDLYAPAPLSGDEQEIMQTALFGNTLPSREAYVDEIAGAGFQEIELTDMAEPWGGFCAERLAAFRTVRDDKLAIHGPETVAALDAFYETMCRLFDGGRMSGARITARKPV